MSNFWNKALGSPASPSSPTPSSVSATARPWWQTSFVVDHQQPQVTPAPSLTVPVVPAPSKAVSARSSEYCPNCGSTNYFRPVGVPNAMAQCFECGSNSRFEQMAYGAGIPGDGAAPKPSKQVSAAHAGYNGGIVGHIG